MNPIWSLVHHERAELVSTLRTLTDDAWLKQSLCDTWSIQDVAAHLLDSAHTTPWSFCMGMIRNHFDFDNQNQEGVNRYRATSPNELIELLSQAVNRTSGPPRFMAPLVSRLVEEIVHGEDIRRPLGISHTYDAEALKAAITYQASTSTQFGGAKENVAKVRLVAIDLGWAYGFGSDVSGPALEILLAITGRSPQPEALSGPGLSHIV